MPLPIYPQIIMPKPSGLSPCLTGSGGDYYMEITETGSGGRNTTIRKKTELTVREELQKDVDDWLGDMV